MILKSNGVPPYNFAHIVDDTLMRTSHVIRGEDWFSSTAEHIQIRQALFPHKKTQATVRTETADNETVRTESIDKGDCGLLGSMAWGHAPVISVEDDGKKRKLSKRKDKHALAETFLDEGYPPEAIVEYLLTLYNSDFETWRTQNQDKKWEEFNFRLEKVGKNNPMFDLAKLSDISRNIIGKKTKQEINREVKEWLERSGRMDEIGQHGYEKICLVLAIDRETPKPRKDIVKYSDIFEVYGYLFDTEERQQVFGEKEQEFLKEYANNYSDKDTKEEWTGKIKELVSKTMYDGNAYMLIRKAVTGREQTPDLYTILKIIGEKDVKNRVTTTGK